MRIAPTVSWMRCVVVGVLASAWLLIPAKATAQRTNSLETLKSQYEAARLDIGLACAEREKDALKQYDKALDSLLAAVKQKGDLDAYLVVHKERMRFSTEKTGPTNDVAALATIVQPYRAAVALADADRNQRNVNLLRRYVTALDWLVATFVRADNIEAANEVKAQRDKAAFELADLESKMPPEDKPAATDEAASPGKTKCLPTSLKKGLVLYYSFDKNEGGKVTDESGKKNDGKAMGARWTPKGKIGAACAFDGANSYISLPDSSSLDMDSTSFTIGLYAYFNVTDQRRHRIVDLNPVIAGYSALLIQQDGNSLLFFASSSGTAWDIADGVPIGSITAGQWYCVVVKRDGNTISTFLNNVAGGSVTSSSSLYHGTYGFDIGRFGPGNCEYFDGLLDEVMIFNRALSEKEVKQIYKVQK